MARGGINIVLVRKARDALLARGQHPSIDSVRIELGNTGSKSTIQRYLKEIEAYEPQHTSVSSRLSDELTELVGKMVKRLLDDGNEVLARERIAFEKEREQLMGNVSTVSTELKKAKQEIVMMLSVQKNQDEELQTTRSTLQGEIARNARISQSCSDLEVRVLEKDEQIQSLEEKHTHAREALEHYRAAVKEQRDQDIRRHDSQLHQAQKELAVLQQTLMLKQDEITRFIRDNERLNSENRQMSKEATQHREAAESLKIEIGIASAATARMEGAKELLQQQLDEKAREASEARSDANSALGREADLLQLLEKMDSELEALRASPESTHVKD